MGGRLYVFPKNKTYVYDQGIWKETLELDLDLVSALGLATRGVINRKPWCVIENGMFKVFLGEQYIWYYDLSCGKWSIVFGFEGMYSKLASDHDRTIQLVNYGGKLVINYMVRVGRVSEGAWA